MIRGMETQLAEWEARMDARVAAAPSIRIGVLFARVFLSGAPLLKLPSARLAATTMDASSVFRADPQRLESVIPALHDMYEYFLALNPADINSFIGFEWGALIMSVIIGFRMSFPLTVCPEWDDRAAREAVRFDEYLGRLCRMGGDDGAPGGGGGEGAGDVRTVLPTAAGSSANNPIPPPAPLGGHTRSMDVLSASKIVLGMVRTKFRKRVAKLERATVAEERQQQQQQQQRDQVDAILGAAAAAAVAVPHPVPTSMSAARSAPPTHESATSGCPMMNGSLEPYFPYWDETFNNGLAASAFPAAGAQGVGETLGQAEMDPPGVGLPSDLWTAMTMGWAQGGVDFDRL